MKKFFSLWLREWEERMRKRKKGKQRGGGGSEEEQETKGQKNGKKARISSLLFILSER
jgi:hypothetical protein